MSTWVFLRGLTRESRHWGDFPARFCRQVAGARVVTLDLPGSGSLNGVSSPCDVGSIADCCRQELAHRKIAPPYHLLALSLGGMVAVAWAMRAPEEVARCVLINSSARPFSGFRHRLRPAAYPDLLRLLLAGGRWRDGEALILRLTSACADSRRHVLDDWIDYRRERPVSRRNALRQIVAAASFRAPGEPPAVPLLLLAGAGDRLVDAGCSRAIAQAWRCDLAVHPSAGHDLPLDDGDWVASRVSDWLQAGAAEANRKAPAEAASKNLNGVATSP